MFAIEELVLIYVPKKETKDLNAPAVVPSLTAICHVLLFVMFSFVLFGAISVITRAGTRAHVHLFSDVWRYKRGPKITWLVTQSTSSTITTHHHDESLLL